MEGVVPEIEEREAAHFNGYRWREWQELDRHEKASNIAYYRVRLLLDQHYADIRDTETKRQQRKMQRRR